MFWVVEIERANSAALSFDLDPMMIGCPAVAQRLAKPEPSAPVPPKIAIFNFDSIE
jgi:hypothetical protein